MKAEVRVQEVNSTLSINQKGAELLTTALLSHFDNRLKCECEDCKKDIRAKKQYLQDLSHLIYPISKLGRHTTIATAKLQYKINLLKEKK